MKIIKRILITIAIVIILVVVIFGIYLLSHRQGVIKPSEFVKPGASKSVLIASQGSKFKNELVDSIMARLKNRPLSVKVIDVTILQEIKETDFSAFVIIHTTEKGELQADVKKFLDRAKSRYRILLVTTSGQGDWKTKEYKLDVITSASRKSELQVLPGRISAWIDSIVFMASPGN
jgi:hypothetical protein